MAGVPFLTFFPAVLVAGLLLGWRWGALTLVAASVVANYVFQPPVLAFALTFSQVVSTFAFVAFGALILATTETLRHAFARLNEAAVRERQLNLELAHRVNNNLAVIQGLARQTFRTSPDPAEFCDVFTGRISALAEAHKVLMSGASQSSSQLPELAEAALRPFRAHGGVAIDGPACSVPMIASAPLVLALHELGTNALKYGALSTPAGRVRLAWSMEGSDCRFVWEEHDGPRVRTPSRQGLGTRLLRAQPGLQDVRLQFDPDGVVCQIVVPDAARVEVA